VLIFLALGWIVSHLEKKTPEAVVQVEPAVVTPLPVPAPPPPVAPGIDPFPERAPEPKPAPVVVAPKPLPPPPTPVEEAPDERLALFKQELLLLGPPSHRQSNQDLFRDALFLALETGRWDLYRPFLDRAFARAMKDVSLRTGPDRFTALLAEPLYVRAMGLHAFLREVPDSFLQQVAESSPEHPFYQWLLYKHETALEEFLESLTGNEDIEQVLKTWSSLWLTETTEVFRDTYRALALACALVYPGDDYNPSDNKALARYTLFRDNAEKGRLTGKIHRMRATELIWVVDVPVSDSEIEWALKKMHLPRRRWGDAYGMIDYLMEKAVESENPYEEYTFAEILKHGGVCADQSYFSANTAKCHGIPAAIVTGTGDRGPHAWIIYKPDKDEWREAGGVGYTTGATKNPANGIKMPIALLTLATDRRTGLDRLAKTRTYLRFMDLFLALGEKEIAREALDIALRNTPSHPLPWKRSIDFHEQEETSLKEWEDLAATLRRRFKDWPDFLELAERIEDEHIFPRRSAKENARDVARERRRLTREHGGRADLVTASIQRQADILAEAENFDGISSLYRRAFQEFGNKSEAFTMIADQYFGYAARKPEWQRKACREIELAYQRHIDTGSGEYFKAKTEIGILRKVAGYYEQCGNKKRAESLRRRATIREKRAKRNAL